MLTSRPCAADRDQRVLAQAEVHSLSRLREG